MNQKLTFLDLLIFISASLSVISGNTMMSIDLGAEYIKIAVVRPRFGLEIVLNGESSRKTRAIVAFEGEERHYESQAENIALKYPEKAVGFLTQILGHQFDDPEVQLYRKRFPYYNLIKDEQRGTVLFKIDENTVYSSEEIFAMLLEKAKEYANKFTKQDIKDAVLTVPAFYNQAERRAVQVAAQMAGINVLQLLSDNAAVALNFGVFSNSKIKSTPRYYMFYDMGSISAVVTIVGYKTVKRREKTGLKSIPQMTVIGTGFDHTLGGLEFTLRLRAHLAKTFNNQEKSSLKVENNERAMAKLWKEAERVKKVLSANNNHYAQVENLLDDKDFRAFVTREEFEQMSQDLFERVTKPIDDALRASKLTLDDIVDVVLMGGGTRIPKIQAILRRYLERGDLGKSINTDEAAALGAVYKAASFSKMIKVKSFEVLEGNVYPISVVYERPTVYKDGQVKSVMYRHTLFECMSPYPQKKIMNFINHTSDFTFNVTYSSHDFITDRTRSFRQSVISRYTLTGIKETILKASKQGDITGIQAHFWMSESGILVLDEVASIGGKIDLTGGVQMSSYSEVVTPSEEFFVSSHAVESQENESPEENNVDAGGLGGSIDSFEQKKNIVAGGLGGSTDSFEQKKIIVEGEDSQKEKKGVDKTVKHLSLKESFKMDREEAMKRNGKDLYKFKDVSPKVINVKKFVNIQQENLDVMDMSEKQVAIAKQRLEDLRKADVAKRKLEKAKK
uniref:Hypoxia up-regulated protein 1 n=2 Tax=Arion vulgaris TaxID=1028688 RepID=A0A0B7BAA7_9EUPU